MEDKFIGAIHVRYKISISPYTGRIITEFNKLLIYSISYTSNSSLLYKPMFFFLYKPRIWFTNYGFVLQTLGLFYKPTVGIQTKSYVQKPRITLQTHEFVFTNTRVCFTNTGFVLQAKVLLYEPRDYFTNIGFGLQIPGFIYKPRVCSVSKRRVCFTTKYTLYNQGFVLQAKCLIYKHIVWYANQGFVIQSKCLGLTIGFYLLSRVCL